MFGRSDATGGLAATSLVGVRTSAPSTWVHWKIRICASNGFAPSLRSFRVAVAPGAGTSTSTGATCRDAASGIAQGDANNAVRKALTRQDLIDMAAAPRVNR